MRRYIKTFGQMMLQIKQDAMLIAACLTPVLAGVLIKYGIPSLEKLLTDYFEVTVILQPYYILFQLILGMITPLVFGVVGALVILGEVDDKIVAYMSVTPVGTRGYLISRLGIPIGISFVINLVVIPLFSLTKITVGNMIVLNSFSCVLGLICSLLIVSFSQNKVEGMAIGKLSGIIITGAFVPFFVTSKVQYVAGVLPSYWLGRYMNGEPFWNLIVGALELAAWCWWLGRKFIKKLEL